MVPIENIWLTGEEVKTLKDRSFMIVEEAKYDELVAPDGKKNRKLVVPVQLVDGSKRLWVPNRKTEKRLVILFGSDTKNWVNKKLVWKVVDKDVFGKVQPVIYVE